MATKTKRWTLDEVHSLPDDGNKYELVRGDLFVTPAPTTDHEIDPEDASITVVRPGRVDETVRDWLAWSPKADAPALHLQLGDVFGVI